MGELISEVNGGCQCGAVRYQVMGAPIVVALCHCSMCRRANAAPAVAWAMYSESQVQFTENGRQFYRSSPEAQRGFCPKCGTQISFTAEYIPGLIDLTVGSFDAPETLQPSLHYWDSKRLPWVKFADALPRHAEFPPFG
ncbi:MAG TPA: GFA family protein [Steroidobacteraceae bacterium]|nr:GFA family protein [Steroidobacteraceae bacterium]